jgi:hypothetical protein
MKHRDDDKLAGIEPEDQRIRKFPQNDSTQFTLDDRERLRISSSRRQCGLEHSDEFETQARRSRLVPVTGLDRLSPRLGPE